MRPNRRRRPANPALPATTDPSEAGGVPRRRTDRARDAETESRAGTGGNRAQQHHGRAATGAQLRRLGRTAEELGILRRHPGREARPCGSGRSSTSSPRKPSGKSSSAPGRRARTRCANWWRPSYRAGHAQCRAARALVPAGGGSIRVGGVIRLPPAAPAPSGSKSDSRRMMSLSCERRSSKRLLRMQQRRAMMALVPATVQRMPARSSRAPIYLHPASTTPDETHRPLPRNCG